MKPVAAFTVEAHVYNAEVRVFRDADRLSAWVKKLGKHWERGGANASALRVIDQDGDPHFAAFIPKASPPWRVCHECLHLAWDILESRGVTVDAANHEALAYLQQHLARQILRKR